MRKLKALLLTASRTTHGTKQRTTEFFAAVEVAEVVVDAAAVEAPPVEDPTLTTVVVL
jgi:hypothetical protein